MGPELRHLRYFVAVAEELNFTRAAERLHIAQPSLSAQIRELERQIGCQVLRRTTRQVELTPAGQTLLEHARRLLIAHQDLADALDQHRNLRKAEPLRVAFSDAETFVRPLIARYTASRPSVTVALIRTDGDSEALTRLAARQVDAVFVWGSTSSFPVADDQASLHVALPETGLVMAANHPLAAEDPVPLTAVSGHDLVMFDRALGPVIYDCLLHQLDPRRRSCVRVVSVVGGNNQESMHGTIKNGELTPNTRELFGRSSLPRDDLVYRPTNPPLCAAIHLVWNRPTRAALNELTALAATIVPKPRARDDNEP